MHIVSKRVVIKLVYWREYPFITIANLERSPYVERSLRGKMKKALTLYLLNPLVDHGFWKFFQYTRKTIKRFRQETHQSYVASLWARLQVHVCGVARNQNGIRFVFSKGKLSCVN